MGLLPKIRVPCHRTGHRAKITPDLPSQGACPQVCARPTITNIVQGATLRKSRQTTKAYCLLAIPLSISVKYFTDNNHNIIFTIFDLAFFEITILSLINIQRGGA